MSNVTHALAMVGILWAVSALALALVVGGAGQLNGKGK